MSRPTNVFISYSHKDKEMVEGLVTFMKPMEQSGLIKVWWDNENLPGSRFLALIDQHLNSSDIVLFCLSPSFLTSDACRSEIDKIQELRKQHFIDVLPIVLKTCLWRESEGKSSLREFLALPQDGRSATSFTDPSDAWQQVCDGVRKIVDKRNRLLNNALTEEFVSFLDDSGLFPQNINRQASVKLTDIFVSPKLMRCDAIYDVPKEIDSDAIVQEVRSKNKVLISGQSQSGKSSLAKIYFTRLRESGFIPVYVVPNGIQSFGDLQAVVSKSLSEQYTDTQTLAEEVIQDGRTVLIVDDYHNIESRSKFLSEMSQVAHLIVFCRDAIVLEWDNATFTDFSKYEIREWRPSKRSELISKWLKVANESFDGNDYYTQLDEKTAIVESTLGKVMSNGIMPSFPYYILAIIAIQDAVAQPLQQEITSQGYCYQWLIVTCLGRAGVKGGDIDSYFNVLAYLAYKIFASDKGNTGFNDDELRQFFSDYAKEFNFYLAEKNVMTSLSRANIFKKNNAGFFSFTDKYLFFFFTAKYIADHLDAEGAVIDALLAKIQINQNAYILIFIAHHSKKIDFLKKMQRFADELFTNDTPCKLEAEDVKVFTKRLALLDDRNWPTAPVQVNANRQQRLQEQDTIEDIRAHHEDTSDSDTADPSLEIRKFLRISEALGRIAKNRAGSFTQPEIKSIIKTEMDLHARAMNAFVSSVSDSKQEDEVVSIIDQLIRRFLKEKGCTSALTREEYDQLARRLFWNLNFYLILVLLSRCAESVGSKKLRKMVSEVCDEDGSSFSLITKHVVSLWLCKEVDADAIISVYKKLPEFNQRLLKCFVIEYNRVHTLEYRDRQKFEQAFGLEGNKLLHGTDA